jgi:hypothetical protein
MDGHDASHALCGRGLPDRPQRARKAELDVHVARERKKRAQEIQPHARAQVSRAAFKRVTRRDDYGDGEPTQARIVRRDRSAQRIEPQLDSVGRAAQSHNAREVRF